jgi:hypothetical protein
MQPMLTAAAPPRLTMSSVKPGGSPVSTGIFKVVSRDLMWRMEAYIHVNAAVQADTVRRVVA